MEQKKRRGAFCGNICNKPDQQSMIMKTYEKHTWRWSLVLVESVHIRGQGRDL
jgi:hypothetical protein